MLKTQLLFLLLFLGDLLEETDVLEWLFNQVDSSEIEEVTSTMLERLISESKHLVVLFCKYLAYIIIALTHTCYLLKNYKPLSSTTADLQLLSGGTAGVGGGQPQQRGVVAPPTLGVAKGYMPVDRVRGMANES